MVVEDMTGIRYGSSSSMGLVGGMGRSGRCEPIFQGVWFVVR